MSLLLDPLSWQSKEIYVCILTNKYTHISISLCGTTPVYIKLSMTSYWSIQPTLIHCRIDYSSHSHCLSVNSCSNSETPSFHHLTSIYLIAQFECTFMEVSELLTLLLWITVLSTWVQCLCAVAFVFSFTDFTHFQVVILNATISLGNHLFPPPSSVRSFHICTIQTDYVVTICIPSSGPPTSVLIAS